MGENVKSNANKACKKENTKNDIQIKFYKVKETISISQ